MSLEGYKKARLKLNEKKAAKTPIYPLPRLGTKWYNVLQTSKEQREDGLRKTALKNMRMK